FFFSSRRRHTRFSRDWSSDVCSSDLIAPLSEASIDEFITRWYHALLGRGAIGEEKAAAKSLELRETVRYLADLATNPMLLTVIRSEERRVGKERSSRVTASH